ncbi:dTDP-4-dehydrorhamnose 3,5-epimerase [Jeongeupia sp. USM3]|uniref:dTDP-4-dehydrorhamnose 3,5-epimerase n=1 Tax=Jeongeupia sp. USM3 TaxID=1906741 RepID=UPI00089DEBD7|nr:dTDP-4-dehydrorhamnose 3,5-epimerase [Jeongeupia sp. USM3]AOX99298.1 dTDP-4-dehydrorhamnose 3,5-epimerase [Jeongeupia sp. USM3]
MIFHPTPIPGAFVIESEPLCDERGFFARTMCVEQFAEHGLNGRFIQQSVSWNEKRGTLRGLHYQTAPLEEEKLVAVHKGAIFDAIVDLRGDSPAYRQWHSVELSEHNGLQLYIPKGVAHGFQTLENDTLVFYQMTVPYDPACAAGIASFDPALVIAWPIVPAVSMSEKDKSLPALQN